MTQTLHPRMLEIIACPRCLARLRYEPQKNILVCDFEKIAYPIERGVPQLLAEKAVPLNEIK